MLSWLGSWGHFSPKGSLAFGTLSLGTIGQNLHALLLGLASYTMIMTMLLRGGVSKLFKKLTHKRRLRLGLTSAGVSYRRKNKYGKTVVQGTQDN